MTEYWQHFLFLLPMGILAGIVSTTAGLASLVSYPALLAVGVPPLFANVTNTAALVMTGLGATVSSHKELGEHRKELIKILPLTIGGSIIGAWLLLAAPASTFEKAVPFFVLVAGLLLLSQVNKSKKNELNLTRDDSIENDAKHPLYRLIVSVGILLVGMYCGYFGAAGGVLLLAILSATTTMPFASYNALKNLSLGGANLIATVIYIFSSHIYWGLVIPMGIGLFIGGWIGPHIVRLIPDKILKIVISIAAVALAVDLFLKAYF
ncbi:sulfite exporter TauE/SafE family protein [Fructobacillus parabroussonetiae]|uniref:Probable membrane transporter protein n=1 Tax=Fructobacillus parabroussonetiae TaxID=2713174 RepID=A0ABS5QWK5_9LACO|nr:sulfite exporter TauE/SafE family protein [Fructobacillus parabroussonetiae]MBS9337583.1 sulfite exporter TauE/SafE family protein [Fructobacillus parabroussonetiae]MCK8617220.1 sulfite exporter TauE/SafE family protein [Fructobacillus parabroussonetiae]